MSKLLLLLTTAVLAWPATAAAHKAHLSMSDAHKLVIQRIGPGTTVGHCNRHSATKITCAYTTPATNAGISTEDPNATWSSWLTIRAAS